MPEGRAQEDHTEPWQQWIIVEGGKSLVRNTQWQKQARLDSRYGHPLSGRNQDQSDENVCFSQPNEEGEDEDRCSDQMQNAKANVDARHPPVRDGGDEHPAAEDEEAAAEIFGIYFAECRGVLCLCGTR